MDSYEFLKTKLREVVEMNVCWQKSYNELMTKVDELNKRDLELSAKVNGLILESNRREVEFKEKTSEFLETISVLEIQATTYKEDFDAERQQRTELSGKLADYERQKERQVIQPAEVTVSFRCVYQTDGSRDEPDAVCVRPFRCVYQTDGSRDEPDTVDVSCPKCKKSFNADSHYEFVNHLSEC